MSKGITKNLDITIEEAAQLAGLSVGTVLRWVANEHVPASGFCFHFQRFLPIHEDAIQMAAGLGSPEVKALFKLPVDLEQKIDLGQEVDTSGVRFYSFDGADKEVFTYFLVKNSTTIKVEKVLIKRSYLKRLGKIVRDKSGFTADDDYTFIEWKGKPFRLEPQPAGVIVKYLHKLFLKDPKAFVSTGNLLRGCGYDPKDHKVGTGFRTGDALRFKKMFIDNSKRGHWKLRIPPRKIK